MHLIVFLHTSAFSYMALIHQNTSPAFSYLLLILKLPLQVTFSEQRPLTLLVKLSSCSVIFLQIYQNLWEHIWVSTGLTKGFPGGTSIEEPTCQCRSCRRPGLDPWAGKKGTATRASVLAWNPMGREAWQATGPGVAKESDTTEHTHTHASWGKGPRIFAHNQTPQTQQNVI